MHPHLRRSSSFIFCVLVSACTSSTYVDQSQELKNWHAMDGANSAAVRVANIKIGIHESLPVIAELSACIERKAPCPTLERTIHAGGVLMGAISMPYNAIERNCARQDVSEYHVHVCLTHDIPRLGVDAGYDHYDDEMLSILTKNPDDGENAWRTFIYPSFTHTNVAYAYSDGYLIIAELVGVKK